MLKRTGLIIIIQKKVFSTSICSPGLLGDVKVDVDVDVDADDGVSFSLVSHRRG
jgi:hypothetical protein